MQNLNSQTDSQHEQDLKSEEDDTLYIDESHLDPLDSDDKKPQDLDVTQSEEGFSEKVVKVLELIYIAKYSPDYRQKLQALAFSYGCDLYFGKNSFKVSCKSKLQEAQWNICKEMVVAEFDKILFKKVDDKEKRFRLLFSSEVNKFAMEKGIYFCQFNSEIYLHSNRYSDKELEEKKNEICKYCNIFTVCFNKKKTLQPIDFEIAKFYRTVLQDFYKERFEKNQIVVEVNRLDRSFYILGKPGSTTHSMMEAKKTMKNLIEGVTVISFKDIDLELKAEIKLKDYLSKISKYPITYGKISETILVIISKDNILKELLKKKQKIIQKLAIKPDTGIGIFMPFCYSLQQKKQQVYKICKEMGYDFWINYGTKYFRPMIASEDDVKNPAEILELVIRIIGGFVGVKETHEVMKTKNAEVDKVDAKKKKQLEEQNKYAYILKNATKDSVQLSKELRRDIMEDEVMMMKRYNVIYNLLQGKQIGPFYIDQVQYDKGVGKGEIKLIEKEKLKKGQFFEVYLKVLSEFEEKAVEDIEGLLVEELKRLKQAAKLGKEEGRSLDNARKIAHMIKKMISVF